MGIAPTIYLGLLTFNCAYALVRGGAPERIGVLILLTGIAASVATPKASVWRHQHVEIGLLIVDVAMLLAIVLLARRAQRYWPMWWGGLKLCAIIVHFMMLAPLLRPWSYAVASAAISFPAPLLIAIGAFRHRIRVKRYGNDPSWSEPEHWNADELLVQARADRLARDTN